MGSRPPTLRVAHLIPYLGRAQGGPVLNLSGCATAQLKLGVAVTILSTRRPDDGPPVAMDSDACLIVDDAPRWGVVRRCPALWNRAASEVVDVVHSHGLWTDVNRLAAVMARRKRVPHILTPCGMLAPGALKRHWWKKLPVRIWFQHRALEAASCLQAQSEIEVDQIRRFGLSNPVALIPAAVPGNPGGPSPASADVRPRFGLPQDGRIVLYLGRLHPVKGLLRLLDAWASLEQLTANRVLVLAGPDENGFAAVLKARAATLRIPNLRFTGPVDDTQKWPLLASAELFVMPSDFENFGLAVVEAMQSRLPVITTTRTPWRELPAQDAGWCVEPTPTALAHALEQALRLETPALQQMGLRAAAFAERFTPQRAAADLLRVYEWLLDRGERPACVRL